MTQRSACDATAYNFNDVSVHHHKQVAVTQSASNCCVMALFTHYVSMPIAAGTFSHQILVPNRDSYVLTHSQLISSHVFSDGH